MPAEALFFVGNQLIATSHTGKIGVWNAVTKHWQVGGVMLSGGRGLESYDISEPNPTAPPGSSHTHRVGLRLVQPRSSNPSVYRSSTIWSICQFL